MFHFLIADIPMLVQPLNFMFEKSGTWAGEKYDEPFSSLFQRRLNLSLGLNNDFSSESDCTSDKWAELLDRLRKRTDESGQPYIRETSRW